MGKRLKGKPDLCSRCKGLIQVEEGRVGCDENLHKNYEPVFDCAKFREKNGL